MSPRVKVCGFTRVADVKAAVTVGVDAFGINLACGPRRVGLVRARELVQAVPPFATAVGLFVDADYRSIMDAVTYCRLQAVQLHGNEAPELAEALQRRIPVIKAFRVRDAETLQQVGQYPADAYLLDAYVPGQAGGTGQGWDLSLLARADLGKPVIVAGGLKPANVADAVHRCQPWGVDTASGVESSPGVKSEAAMRAFVAAAKQV